MRIGNIIAVSVIAGLGATASAKESYKFDPSGSTVGFSVHQFLGTTRGNFMNFSGTIEISASKNKSSFPANGLFGRRAPLTIV